MQRMTCNGVTLFACLRHLRFHRNRIPRGKPDFFKRSYSKNVAVAAATVTRPAASALYPGSKNRTATPLVYPELRNIKLMLADKERLKSNLLARCKSSVINVDELVELWPRMEQVRGEMASYRRQVQSLENDIEDDEDGARRKQHYVALRDANKNLREEWAHLEEIVICRSLGIPNWLHKDTPTNGVDVNVMSHGKQMRGTSHTEAGDSCISFNNNVAPTAYYLQGKSALLELALQDYISEKLENNGFKAICAPDTYTSAIIESCGGDWSDPSKYFTVEDRFDDAHHGFSHHLIGGASLEAFVGSLTRCIIQEASLPLRYYTVGRRYSPDVSVPFRLASDAQHEDEDHSNSGLFAAYQTVQANLFEATWSAESAERCFHDNLSFVLSTFRELDLTFRVQTLCSEKLADPEMLRCSVQLWIPSVERHLEFAHVSLLGDHVSSRLLMKYGKGKGRDMRTNYLHIVHGVCMNVTHLVAGIMEQLEKREDDGVGFTIPAALEEHIMADTQSADH